jgi:hypothetical protein
MKEVFNSFGTLWQIYTVKNAAGWLDFIDPPFFSTEGKSCLLRIPWRDGEGYFRHVVWLDVLTRKEIPITRGPLFEVTEIVAWDQASQFM